MNLAGEVALITGAAGPDIGFATASAFLRLGAAGVIVTDRSERRVANAVSELSGSVPDAKVVGRVLDLRSPETFGGVIADARKEVGPPTILVNNAAVTRIAGFDEISEEEWDEAQLVNLKAPWLLSRLLAPEMKHNGRGAIVNISSVAAYMPGWRESHYSISKAGLNALTRELACELGAAGVRVNTVAPGCIDTVFIRDHAEKYRPVLDATPLQRFPTKEEVVEAVTFLASPAASGITGEVINVTGGWYMPA